MSNGNGTFSKSNPFNNGNWLQGGWGTRLVGDFNGDGNDDIVSFDYLSSGTSGYTWLAMSNGDGTFSKSNPFNDGNWLQGSGSSYIIKDFNGDGNDDIASFDTLHNGTSGYTWLAMSNGDGTFRKINPFNDGNWLQGGWGDRISGDFNGDGVYDVASFDYYNGGASNYSWLAMSSNQNQIIHGGNGNDDIYGEAGNDKIYGEEGNDNIFGGSDNDELHGGSGNDDLKCKNHYLI